MKRQLLLYTNKEGCVFPIVIWSKFRMRQYKHETTIKRTSIITSSIPTTIIETRPTLIFITRYFLDKITVEVGFRVVSYEMTNEIQYRFYSIWLTKGVVDHLNLKFIKPIEVLTEYYGSFYNESNKTYLKPHRNKTIKLPQES